jgi:molybdopterin molybdotransferase
MSDPVEWHRARTLSFAAGAALPAHNVALGDASGRRLAADVTALIDVPHYASSAMDGWAVSGAPPWRLVHTTDAYRTFALRPGEATPILTGSLVPAGTLGVLRSEHGDTSPDGAALRPNGHARPGEPRRGLHVRPRGEEAASGDVLFHAGALLSPAHVAVLAASGHDAVVVRRRPRVGLVLTGDEVVDAGLPGPGRVRDSFGPSLPAMLACLGVDVVSVRHLPDDRQLLVEALGADAPDAGECDVLVTTGGTGGSSADHLRAALRAHGAEILIGGVRMRPGGPSLLARMPDGRVVGGLPGNPLAAVMGVLTLVTPLIAALSGAPLEPLDEIALGARVTGAEGSVSLVPFQRVHTRAQPTAWRGSGMLRGLAAADGVLVVPPGGAEFDQAVTVLRLPWAAGFSATSTSP